jgi:hypothetical protein
MKIKLLLVFVFGVIYIGKAQDSSVEKSVFGLQTGLLGVWMHHEARLSNQIALRTEIGLDSGIWGGDFYDGIGFLMTPVITVEPRWYYNLNKRETKGKSTAGNSGNFLALKTSVHPDWFVISNADNVRVIGDVSVVPTWGIRRSIGSHFNFETGLGLGYRCIFAKQAGYAKDYGELAVNVHLRFGYRF